MLIRKVIDIKEYIEVPKYFKKDVVYSPVLLEFLNNISEIESNKIPIEILRKYYKENKEKGMNLIFEMKLRGFKFRGLEDNFFLKTIDIDEPLELIYTPNNDGKINNLNKRYFSDFNYISYATSDFYFNLIPIKAFKNIDINYNENIVKNEFISSGYEVIKTYDLDKIESFNGDTTLLSQVKESSCLEIDIIFEENKYNMFKVFCKEKGIKCIEDLDEDIIKNFRNTKGVGEKRFEEVMLKLKGVLDLDLNKTESNSFKEKMSEKEKAIYKSILIEDIIPARYNKYLAFKNINRKLEEDGIKNLYDIISYDLDNLKTLDNVGKKTMDDFTKEIDKQIENVKEYASSIETDSFVIEGEIYSILEEKSILELMEILEIKYENLEESSKDFLALKIKDINGTAYREIDDLKLFKILVIVKKKIYELLDVSIIFSKIKNNILDERCYFILKERNREKKTLEELGSKLNITRERVRQIENNAIKLLNKILKEEKFISILKLYSGNSISFKTNELYSFLHLEAEKDYKALMLLVELIKNDKIKGLYYSEIFDKMYYFDVNERINEIKEYVKILPKFGNIQEIYDLYEISKEILNELSFSDFDKILKEEKILIKNELFLKGKLNRVEIITLYLKYINKGKIRLYDEYIDELNEDISRHFVLDKDLSARNWIGVADRADELLQIGPKTYGHIDNFNVEKDVLRNVKKILDEKLERNPSIYSDVLYAEVEKIYPSVFKNKHHIYSIIKYYYGDEYNTGHGNTMKLALKDYKFRTNNEIVYDLCKKHGSIISSEEIVSHTNWPSSRLDMLAHSSEDIYKIGPNKYAILDDIIDEKTKKRLKEIIDEEFKEGWTTIGKIYEEFIYDELGLNLINKLEIGEPKNLSTVIKYLDSDIKGHSVFLYYKDQEVTSIEKAVLKKFPLDVYREEIEQFLKRYKYTEGLLSVTIDNLLRNKLYVQIDFNKYKTADEFYIPESIKVKLINYAKDIVDKDGYFVPNNHINYIYSNIPQIEDGWNQFTIYSVLKDSGFKRLYRYGMAYMVDIIVLVQRDSKYDQINEFVRDLLLEEYDGRMHEKDIYKYLMEKGIYERKINEADMRLSEDVYKDVMEIDLVGNVSIKGQD